MPISSLYDGKINVKHFAKEGKKVEKKYYAHQEEICRRLLEQEELSARKAQEAEAKKIKKKKRKRFCRPTCKT